MSLTVQSASLTVQSAAEIHPRDAERLRQRWRRLRPPGARHSGAMPGLMWPSYRRVATSLTLAFHMTLGRQCPPAQVATKIHPKTEDRNRVMAFTNSTTRRAERNTSWASTGLSVAKEGP